MFDVAHVMQEYLSRMLGISYDKIQLTGSHYFGTNHPRSDMDFFVHATDVNEVVFHNNGFYRLFEGYGYLDSNTKAVWRNDLHLRYDNRIVPVDVQVVRYFDLKVKTQKSLKEKGYGKILAELKKPSRHIIWNAEFERIRNEKPYNNPCVGEFENHRIPAIRWMKEKYPYLSLREARDIVYFFFDTKNKPAHSFMDEISKKIQAFLREEKS